MDELITSLKTALGTAFSLYIKFHGAHWNVEGIHFHSLHAFFEMLYKDTWQSLDDIAEQIRQLDAYTPCSPERLTELSHIVSNNNVMAPIDLMGMLFKDNDIMIGVLTEAFHHANHEDRQGLANFLAERIAAHSKWRWQLRATIKRIG